MFVQHNRFRMNLKIKHVENGVQIFVYTKTKLGGWVVGIVTSCYWNRYLAHCIVGHQPISKPTWLKACS